VCEATSKKKQGRDASAISFLDGRFSARDFAPRSLNDPEIAAVIELAQRAPSQCNRQSTRIHVYRNRAKIAKLLELQGGARGFAEAVPTLFIVTSEITAWGARSSATNPLSTAVFLPLCYCCLWTHMGSLAAQ